MQTFEELTRQSPDKSQLLSLRARVLSDGSEPEVDRALHSEFVRSSVEFIEVAASLTYQVPGQSDHKIQNSQWLWRRDESVGWVDEAEVTHYWEGKQPGFWDDLMPVPRYTTRVEDALKLKWALHDTDIYIRLEERIKCERDDDGPTFTRAFSASVCGADQECLSTAECGVAAKAIIVAIIDYLLAVKDAV